MALNVELRRSVSGNYTGENKIIHIETDWSAIKNKPTNFVPTSHPHDAEDITSGTFESARIPTLPISKIADLSSHLSTKVDKVTVIKAGTGLAGGGNLSEDITLSLSSASGTAYNATRWNNYRMRVGSGSLSGYISFGI